jgi:hypothetical protein
MAVPPGSTIISGWLTPGTTTFRGATGFIATEPANDNFRIASHSHTLSPKQYDLKEEIRTRLLQERLRR